MDFTPELSAFQGAFISADNIHPFSKITSKSGNENKIEFIVNSALNFLQEKKFYNNGIVKEYSATYRKFSLYLVLNTDFHILEELMNNEEIDLIVWTLPILTKCLMCELFLNLHMEIFLYEIATFSYPPLSLEIAEAFIDHFKYMCPIEYLEQLKKITIVCYTVICRFNFFEFGRNKFSIYLSKAFSNFEKFVKYFLDPSNKEKLNTANEDEIYKQQGKFLYAGLCCLHECLIQFTSHQERQPRGLDYIYTLTYPEESVKKECASYNVVDSPTEILEVLSNCNVMLLDAVQALVMEVSVEIYCAWNEFELNQRNMQETIGELCYKLHTKLLEVPSICDHQLLTMIKKIAIKPADLKVLINSIDTESILANINKSDDEKLKWLPALIYKEQLFKYTELLHIIDDNLANYNKEECYKLYEMLKNSPENKDLTEPLTTKLFDHCSIIEKFKILDAKFHSSCFFDMPETAEFSVTLTEVFNKFVVSPDSDLADVLTLFFQNPLKVYVKIFNSAIENKHQVDIMLDVMKLIDQFSNHYYETDTQPCVTKVAHDMIDLLNTNTKQNNYIKFIYGLKEMGVIRGSQLLILIIMPNIHTALLSKDINKIHIQTKLLGKAYQLEELIPYRAPVLAMLAQSLEIVRWKVDTFEPLGPTTLQMILMLQKYLFITYANGIMPEKEMSWLKSKLKNIQPLNMYYYRRLWNPPGDNFLAVISGNKIKKGIRLEAIMAFLTKILCSCTQQEWFDIWDSLSDFPGTLLLYMFSHAMSVVARAEKSNSTINTWKCILYCYGNLIFLIRFRFLKEPISDLQVSEVIKTIEVTRIFTDGNPEEMEPILLPLFSYLAQKKSDYTIDLTKCTLMKHSIFVSIINKVL